MVKRLLSGQEFAGSNPVSIKKVSCVNPNLAGGQTIMTVARVSNNPIGADLSRPARSAGRKHCPAPHGVPAESIAPPRT